MIVEFFVPGIPKPAGSKNGFAIKKGGKYTGKVAMVDASGKAGANWRADVRAKACEVYSGPPLSIALRVDFIFSFPRPKKHYYIRKSGTALCEDAPRWHTTTPDRTKATRGIEDSLKGVLWVDDNIIVAGVTLKRYCNEGERPGVLIRVQEAG